MPQGARHSLPPEVKLGFLGPEGTFTEAALRRYAGDHAATPYTDVLSALAAVRAGEIDVAVVPIENSVEGGVNATLDALGEGEPLVIVGEVLLPITFVLAAPQVSREMLRIGTHPHAWAQCRHWLHATFPGVEHVPTSSTAAAAAALADGTAEFDAALCSQISAEKYQLRSLATDIADNRNAVTRFVAVARPARLPAPTGADKTTLMVHLGHNEAGGLLEMLEQFAARGINLSRIESRPIGDALGRYAFSIDAEGHVAEERMQDVLIGLHRISPMVRFIGSYPAADGRRPPTRQGTADSDFAAAREWLASILSQDGEPINLGNSHLVSGPDNPQSALLPDSQSSAKNRIRTAALAEFYHYGYDGASMRRVALAARADSGLITYHFGGKRGLFQAAVIDALPDLGALVNILIAETHEEFAASLQGLSAGDVSAERAALVALIRTSVAPTPDPDSIQQQIADFIETMIQRAIDKSPDPRRAELVLKLLAGVVVFHDVLPISPLVNSSWAELTDKLWDRIELYDPELPDLDPPQRPPRAVPEVDDSASERILRAASELFAEWGGNRASLRDIAAKADCHLSLVHYYFGGKSGLLSAVLDKVADPIMLDDAGKPDLAGYLAKSASTIVRDSSSEFVQVVINSAANPGSADLADVILSKLQAQFDAYFGDLADGDVLSFQILIAELVGSMILTRSSKLSDARIYSQTDLFARRLIERAYEGK